MRHVRRALVVTFFAAAAVAARAEPQGLFHAQRQASLQPAPQFSSQSSLQATTGTASGLPVPRFVSLKSDKVNMHIGPAKTYEVKWLYQRKDLPVEIIAEFETWRRIRDADGTEGWVYHSLLSGRRTGMVTTKGTDELVSLHDKPNETAAVTARLERGVIATVKRCSGEGWCFVTGRGFEGYVQQARLWGVYPNEKLD
jgi:SH3-like domain-containing protein